MGEKVCKNETKAALISVLPRYIFEILIVFFVFTQSPDIENMENKILTEITSSQKNIEELIHALSLVKKKGQRFKMLLAGSGINNEKLTTLINICD